jgi:Mitochondrial carrier protein
VELIDIQDKALGIAREYLKNDFVAGSLVGTATVIVVNPLVNIKFNQQQAKITELSFKALYRGTVVNLWFYLPITALQVGVARNLSRYCDNAKIFPVIFSGMFAAPLNCALERIVITQNNHKLSMLNAINHIYKQHGIKDFLTRGLFFTALRESIYVSGYLWLPRYYEQYMSKYCNSEKLITPVAGVAAGITASLLSQPIDSCKTLLQASPNPQSFFKAASKMRLRDLFSGFMPRAGINVSATLLSHVLLTVIDKFCGRNEENAVYRP